MIQPSTPSHVTRKPRKLLTAAERYQRKVARISRLMQARDSIAQGSHEVFDDNVTRQRCCNICDVEQIPQSTWDYWRKKCLAKSDRKFLPVGINSFPTHVALITIACSVAGNRTTCEPTLTKKQIGMTALARTLESVSGADISLWADAKQLMPDIITLEQLEAKINEIIPVPCRTQKYATQWRRRKKTYTRSEANQILKQLNHPQAR